MASHILDTHPIPTETSTAIDMPQKIIRCGPRKEKANHGQDAWKTWLKARKVGESFLVHNYSVQYVKRIATLLDYDIVTAVTPRPEFKTRVWIYGKPGHRNPIIKRTTIILERKVTRKEVIHRAQPTKHREAKGKPNES